MTRGEALLEGIEAKTGKSLEDFVALAHAKGFSDRSVKPGVIMSWLKGDEVGLGHGYAMALTHHIQQALASRQTE